MRSSGIRRLTSKMVELERTSKRKFHFEEVKTICDIASRIFLRSGIQFHTRRFSTEDHNLIVDNVKQSNCFIDRTALCEKLKLEPNKVNLTKIDHTTNAVKKNNKIKPKRFYWTLAQEDYLIKLLLEFSRLRSKF